MILKVKKSLNWAQKTIIIEKMSDYIKMDILLIKMNYKQNLRDCSSGKAFAWQMWYWEFDPLHTPHVLSVGSQQDFH